MMAQYEQQFDSLFTRVKALEDALTKLPEINMQQDESRPPGVVVETTSPVEPQGLV